jgi:CheY-like chemotaxis protein
MIAPVRLVLLVDDDASIRRIGELSLSAIGKLEVILAASGDEALLRARESSPDVILLDVTMPGLSGVETFEQLRGDPRTRAIPIVYLTARSGSEEAKRYAALGAAGVIAKPFDPMTLASTLLRTLERA